MPNNLRNEKTDQLFANILKLETIDECYAFFEDLCTINELESLTQRLDAARLFLEGNTYETIIKEIEISSATLSRVSKCFKHGNGGYRLVLERK